MKGKKTDSEFIEQFINQCLAQQQLTSEEIVYAASQEIEQIDIKIQETERLKKRRSKLLDVIYTFQKPTSFKNEEAKILSLFDIKYPDICKFICYQLKLSPCNRDQLSCNQILPQDINFCLKQLLEYQVIIKVNNLFFGGKMFEKYLKSVLQDI